MTSPEHSTARLHPYHPWTYAKHPLKFSNKHRQSRHPNNPFSFFGIIIEKKSGDQFTFLNNFVKTSGQKEFIRGAK